MEGLRIVIPGLTRDLLWEEMTLPIVIASKARQSIEHKASEKGIGNARLHGLLRACTVCLNDCLCPRNDVAGGSVVSEK